MRFKFFLILLFGPLFIQEGLSQRAPARFSISPRVITAGVPADLEISAIDMPDAAIPEYQTVVHIGPFAAAADTAVQLQQGSVRLNQVIPESDHLRIEYHDQTFFVSVIRLPSWLALMPPLIAILLAVIFRQVIIALFAGVWLGAFFLTGYRPIEGLARVLDHYLINAVADPDHASIIMFSMVLGGMVGIITRNGGTRGIVQRLSGWADHPSRGQIAAWAMGLLIFFDDYANTLIVGNMFRPVTDRLRISREKLAYIVDSTSAPVVSIAIFSTWIGFEVGLLQDAFDNLGVAQNSYAIFISTLPYRFYSILTILFVFFIASSGRDFGPMLIAERRARSTGQVLRPGAIPLASIQFSETGEGPDTGGWWNAMIPIAVVIVSTLAALYFIGRASLLESMDGPFSLRRIFGAANPFQALLWSGFLGSVTAGLLSLIQRLLSLREVMDAWVEGVKSMVLAMIVIVFAWSIGQVCTDLHTAEVVMQKTQHLLSPHWMPMLTFVIAALISFATGTSWGAMTILIPIIIPMAWYSAAQQSGTPEAGILSGTIAAVLSGSIWGDHCSPISDTTIMSSMASGSDHIDHVRTQLPYALFIGLLAILCGYLPAGFGWPPLVSGLCGIGIILLVIRLAAKPVQPVS